MLPTLHKVWDSPLDLLRDMDRAINSRFNFDNEDLTAKYPVDIYEDADGLTVTAEMPGFTRDQVEVSIDNGLLTIAAQRDAAAPKDESTTHLRERRFTRVRRQFTLPTTVDAASVEAKLADGLLTLRLKKKEEVKPRKIEVK